MKHEINLTETTPKKIYSLPGAFSGQNPGGQELALTNYYITLDQKPFYGISGEFHFSRCPANMWEDELVKMKMCGINIVSTYVFWIHHEEEKDIFNFSGRRNLRKFLKLCQKHGLYVIVRIGPFAHGEVRNGGLPDWLYGMPCQVRTTDPFFLGCVKRFYGRLAQEMAGLYFSCGGPVIGAQLDNEYMHSAAPWEITTGTSDEWVPSGRDGEEYMRKLLGLAKEAGINVPFYTCTAWGGASTPQELLPLWGGYAFRPWIFYSRGGKHPATEEYLYRDNHNNEVPKTYNFEPSYAPETKPYLCCEMGGGMNCSYRYRFQLPYESVDAMANIKLASGCNMLGYYMFHGGTNPKGKRAEFLNECQMPKMSYDYQAPLGEFGQVRPSYQRLKALHLFLRQFGEKLCRMKTVLPEDSQKIQPQDTAALRYAVRVGEDGSGFLFLNNYQDHAQMKEKAGESVTLRLPNRTITFQNIGLAAGENCVLPFGLDLGGIVLQDATAQPLTCLKSGGTEYAFFFALEGMTPVYHFAGGTKVTAKNPEVQAAEGESVSVKCPTGRATSFAVRQNGKSLHVVTLTRRQSLGFYKVEIAGTETALVTNGCLLFSGRKMRVEADHESVDFSVFPAGAFEKRTGLTKTSDDGIFSCYQIKTAQKHIVPRLKQIGETRYTVDFPENLLDGLKQAILRIEYSGDVGQAFLDGDMISDNFCNGAAWEIGLSEFEDRLKHSPLVLTITPLKEGRCVNVESSMAGRREEFVSSVGRVNRVSVKPVYEWIL